MEDPVLKAIDIVERENVRDHNMYLPIIFGSASVYFFMSLNTAHATSLQAIVFLFLFF
jgi:hypothetical protein